MNGIKYKCIKMITRKSIWFILVKGKCKRLMGHIANPNKVLSAFVFYPSLVFFIHKEKKLTDFRIHTVFIS